MDKGIPIVPVSRCFENTNRTKPGCHSCALGNFLEGARLSLILSILLEFTKIMSQSVFQTWSDVTASTYFVQLWLRSHWRRSVFRGQGIKAQGSGLDPFCRSDASSWFLSNAAARQNVLTMVARHCERVFFFIGHLPQLNAPLKRWLVSMGHVNGLVERTFSPRVAFW